MSLIINTRYRSEKNKMLNINKQKIMYKINKPGLIFKVHISIFHETMNYDSSARNSSLKNTYTAWRLFNFQGYKKCLKKIIHMKCTCFFFHISIVIKQIPLVGHFGKKFVDWLRQPPRLISITAAETCKQAYYKV